MKIDKNKRIDKEQRRIKFLLIRLERSIDFATISNANTIGTDCKL